MPEQRLQSCRRASLLVIFLAILSELQVLMFDRPAYRKLARLIPPITTAAMREPSQTDDMPYANEKQSAWLEQSYHWWRLYRSFTRAWGLLSRVYSWQAIDF